LLRTNAQLLIARDVTPLQPATKKSSPLITQGGPHGLASHENSPLFRGQKISLTPESNEQDEVLEPSQIILEGSEPLQIDYCAQDMHMGFAV